MLIGDRNYKLCLVRYHFKPSQTQIDLLPRITVFAYKTLIVLLPLIATALRGETLGSFSASDL